MENDMELYNFSGSLRCGFLLVLFTEWILCSPLFCDGKINLTINWEDTPLLHDAKRDVPLLRDAEIDSTINMDKRYNSTRC